MGTQSVSRTQDTHVFSISLFQWLSASTASDLCTFQCWPCAWKLFCAIPQQKNTNKIWLDGFLTIKGYQNLLEESNLAACFCGSCSMHSVCHVGILQQTGSTRYFYILLNLPNEVWLVHIAYEMLSGAHIQQGKSTYSYILIPHRYDIVEMRCHIWTHREHLVKTCIALSSALYLMIC